MANYIMGREDKYVSGHGTQACVAAWDGCLSMGNLGQYVDMGTNINQAIAASNGQSISGKGGHSK